MKAPALFSTEPYDSLVSYHYFRNHDTMVKLTEHRRLRLIADSGAFSAFTQGATISLTEYATWIQTYRHGLYWAAALDVFGDPEATYRNWATLRDDHGLDTVPTLHIGADPTLMDAYAAQGVDFLALGGMVGMPPANLTRWMVHILRYARDHHPQMRFHAWGVSNQTLLEKLPLYSIDSSGLITPAYRYGRLHLWHPRKRALVDIALNGRDPLKHQRLFRDVYGVEAKDFLKSHKGNRHALVLLAKDSTQRRAAHLQRLHNVSPPRWGINPMGTDRHGTRMHAVLCSTDLHRVLTPVPTDECTRTSRGGET